MGEVDQTLLSWFRNFPWGSRVGDVLGCGEGIATGTGSTKFLPSPILLSSLWVMTVG